MEKESKDLVTESYAGNKAHLLNIHITKCRFHGKSRHYTSPSHILMNLSSYRCRKINYVTITRYQSFLTDKSHPQDKKVKIQTIKTTLFDEK